MQAALLYGKEDLRVQEMPTPEIQENEVLLQVKNRFCLRNGCAYVP